MRPVPDLLPVWLQNVAEPALSLSLTIPQIAGLVFLGILLFPLIRWLIWRMFGFEQRVAGILSQKKSSEVRLGKISESLAPVLQGFPVDPKKPGTSTIFLGQPVDFIHFDPERGIVLVEVKSGNSKLSANQKRIKELVKEGQIEWLEFRVS